MCLYTLILVVATVEIQAIMLTIEVYVRGFVLFLLIANLFQLGLTFYFYLESIQFKIADPLDRTGFNTTTLDLIYWTMLQTVPRIILTFSIHLFLVDIVAHFEGDPTKLNGQYNPVLLSALTDWFLAVKDDVTKWVNNGLTIAQNWSYNIYLTYLTPDKLTGYITTYVFTTIFVFIRDEVFQV